MLLRKGRCQSKEDTRSMPGRHHLQRETSERQSQKMCRPRFQSLNRGQQSVQTDYICRILEKCRQLEREKNNLNEYFHVFQRKYRQNKKKQNDLERENRQLRQKVTEYGKKLEHFANISTKQSSRGSCEEANGHLANVYSEYNLYDLTIQSSRSDSLSLHLDCLI